MSKKLIKYFNNLLNFGVYLKFKNKLTEFNIF